MRWLTLLLVACLVLAASGQAWASPILFKLINADNGAAYNLQPNVLVSGEPNLNAIQAGNAAGAMVIPAGYANAGLQEDTWGILQVTTIMTDPLDGSTPQYIWQAGGSTELVGIVYGGVDTAAFRSISGGTDTTTIQTTGFHVDLYLQPSGNFATANGPSDRLAFDQYKGVGYSALGVPIVGSQLLMQMDSTPGFGMIDPTQPGEQLGSFTTTSPIPGGGAGTSNMFLDIMGGDWQPLFEVPQFYFPNTDLRFGTSQDGDLFATTNIVPDQSGVWSYTSDDPVRGNMVPEPATMVLVALGGLGVLFGRKRK